jgi:hypothetical protein
MAVRSGAERTAAAAARVLSTDAARGALVHLQRPALDPVTVRALRQQGDLLPRLRAAVASAAGIEVPKLAEAKRVSWVNLVFGIGTLIGIWADHRGPCRCARVAGCHQGRQLGVGGADICVRSAAHSR